MFPSEIDDGQMPLTPFLAGAVFRPDEIAVMVVAYEAALRQMDLTGHTEPRAEMLARSIVVLAKNGERDPVRLRERAIVTLTLLQPAIKTPTRRQGR
jgi:hypothetical protein